MKIYKYITLAGLLTFGQLVVQAQAILLVDQTATGTGDGSSWANAYTDLQTAIDAGAATPFAQVWVKEGTYKSTSGIDRTISFIMKNDVEIYGGFIGSENNLGQRDWVANETILSGDIGTVGLKTDNTNNIINNNYLSTAPLTASAILDGVIVEDGYSNMTPLGGAGLINVNASPIIRNCTFRNNEITHLAGGGIYNTEESSPIILACIFYGNTSTWGGAVAYRNPSDFSYANNVPSTIANCLFYDNSSAQVGGAIYVANYLVNIINNTITENSAPNGGAGINYAEFGSGGPLLNNAVYSNNIIWGNTTGSIVSGVTQIRLNSQGPVFTSNIVEGTVTGLPTTATLNVNPVFIDTVNDDFSIDYCNSPAIDIGSSANLPAFLTTDIDQNARIFNGSIDIGAYESQIVKPFFSAIETVDVNCFGAANGAISINAGGGSGALVYSTDGVNFTSNTVISGLDIGAYTLSVKDVNDCIVTSSIAINQPTEMILSTTSENIDCNEANNGTITVSAFGSSGTYEYQLNTVTFQSSNIFLNLQPGNYTVNVRDQGTPTCITSTSVTITQPDLITISASATDISCNGQVDGKITVTASGGIGTLEYGINNTDFQSSNIIENLVAGTYSVYVRDANSCIVSSGRTSFVIEEPTTLSTTVTKVDIVCSGEQSGQIQIVATGGTAPLEYSIDGTTFQSSPSFTSLSGGTFTAITKDANGCTLTDNVAISEPDVFISGIQSQNISCNGNEDGSITLAPTGGTSPYEFSIDGTNFSSNSDYTSLPAGDYTVSILDANSCQYTESLTIIEPGALSLTASFDGQVSLMASGGVAPYEYSSDGITFQSEATFNLPNGQYTFTVRDINGCTATTQQSLFVTALDNAFSKEQITIYPNPVADEIHISGLAENSMIRLIDNSGRVVLSYKADSGYKTLSLEPLKKGLYLLEIRKGTQKINQTRIVKE